MLLTFHLKPAGSRRISLATSVPGLLTLTTGLLATALLFLWMYQHEQDLEDSYFELRASAYVLAFRERLTDSVHALELVNQSFKSFAPVSAEQFHVFTEPLLARYPYIQNLSFHRLVSNADRPAFEAEMRKRHPDFSIVDLNDMARVRAAVRDRYRVIQYLEPMAGNEVVFGMDVNATTSRQDDAIRRAARTGKASASELFPLPQRKDGERAFSIVMPVYRHDANGYAADERPEYIIGYTLANFRAADCVKGILFAGDLLSVPADISVYSGPLPVERDLVYRKGSAPSLAKAVWPMPEWLFRDRPRPIAHTLDMAGTPWKIIISSPPAPFMKHHRGSLLALFGGMLFSVLAAGYMRTVALRSQRIQRLVQQRTAELKVANLCLTKDIAAREQAEQRLQHTQRILMNAQKVAHVGSWVFNPRTSELDCSDEFFRICGLEPQSIKPNLEFALKIVHPDDQEKEKEAIIAALDDGKEYRVEKRIVRPDGSIRYVVSRGEVLSNQAQGQMVFVGSLLDVTEQKETEVALRKSREKLRELAAYLEQVREDERKRIAREIHDEFGALLTAIKAHLSVAIDTAASSGAAPDTLLTDAAQLADVATEAVRRVVADLRPSVLDQLGVWAALEWYVSRIEERTRLRAECMIEARVAAMELNPDPSTMVFRVVQEALTNVVRHAEASRVTVRAMLRDDSIVVVVEDDGKGIDAGRLPDSRSWGIIGMHERVRYFGGELTITGTPGRGTEIVLRLPLVELNGK